MPTEIRVPTLGESVTEATVGQWFKKPGENVATDEPLVELETDKVTIEVPSPSAGVLADILVQEGDTVEVGALLASISEAGAVATPAPAQATKPIGEAPPASPRAAQAPLQPKQIATQMPLPPSVRKLVADQKIDPAIIHGSGKRGQVLKGDVLSAIENGSLPPTPRAAPAASPAPVQARAQTPAPAPAPAQNLDIRSPSMPSEESREERVRMSKLRQTIARRLKDAQNAAAMLSTFNEVDMTAIMALRTQYKDLFEKKHGVKLGFMGFFVKACIQALKEIPAVNAEIDGTDLVYKNYYHIGIAVGTQKGLVVPVVKDADMLSLSGIEKTINEYGRRARDGKLSIQDMQGGTFTISNGGVYGSLMSTPILNAPQSGILGMHKIQQRPMVVNGQVVARPMMYLALSYDHRVVDGKEAVTFLVRVKECLEDPQRLVLDL